MTTERIQLFMALRRIVDSSELHADAVATAVHVHRSDADALLHLRQAEAVGEEVGASDLARVVRLSAPATSAMLSRLERSGHITRRPSAGDRRRVAVSLTAAAHALLAEPVDGLLTALSATLDGHEPGALLAAAAVLDDVADAIDAQRDLLEAHHQ